MQDVSLNVDNIESVEKHYFTLHFSKLEYRYMVEFRFYFQFVLQGVCLTYAFHARLYSNIFN